MKNLEYGMKLIEILSFKKNKGKLYFPFFSTVKPFREKGNYSCLFLRQIINNELLKPLI
jgi:hypothetical protein